MKLLIINRYGPPDLSPTARLVGDLAARWREEGYEVEICAGLGYQSQHRGALRAFSEARAWWDLAWRALRVPDVQRVVVFSSPAMVLLLGVGVGILRKAPVWHWVMDLYPDVAHALVVRLPGWVWIWARMWMRAALMRCQRVVAVSPAMKKILAERYDVEAEVVYPWPDPLVFSQPISHQTAEKVWLYSGNLGRAHDVDTLLAIQEELEKHGNDWTLCVQGSGSGWERIRAEASRQGLKRVECRGRVEADQLLEVIAGAAVRVVTLRPEASGLLWPSKWALVGAMASLGAPALWIGPVEDATHPLEELRNHLKADRNDDLKDDGKDDLKCQLKGAAYLTPGQAVEAAHWIMNVVHTSDLKRGWTAQQHGALMECVDLMRTQGLDRWSRWAAEAKATPL